MEEETENNNDCFIIGPLKLEQYSYFVVDI